MRKIAWTTFVAALCVLSVVACGRSASGSLSPTGAPSPTPEAATASPAPTANATAAPKVTTYSSRRFEIPITLSFGPEWHVSDDLSDELLVVGGTHAYEGVELAFMSVNAAQVGDPDGTGTLPWPSDFLGYLQSNAHLQVGEPAPVMVDRVSGVRVDVVIAAEGGRRTLIKLKDYDWFYLDYDQDWRFVILDDVGGKRLLIGTTEAPAGFAAAVALAQGIVDTVKFAN